MTTVLDVLKNSPLSMFLPALLLIGLDYFSHLEHQRLEQLERELDWQRALDDGWTPPLSD
jgi:hypothetical protein